MPGSFNQTFTKPGSMVVVSRCFSLCKWTYEITVYFLSCQKLWRHFHGFPNTLLIWNMYENRFTFVRSITMIHETYQETPVKIDPKQQHKTPQSAAFALWNRKIQKQLCCSNNLQIISGNLSITHITPGFPAKLRQGARHSSKSLRKVCSLAEQHVARHGVNQFWKFAFES